MILLCLDQGYSLAWQKCSDTAEQRTRVFCNPSHSTNDVCFTRFTSNDRKTVFYSPTPPPPIRSLINAGVSFRAGSMSYKIPRALTANFKLTTKKYFRGCKPHQLCEALGNTYRNQGQHQL